MNENIVVSICITIIGLGIIGYWAFDSYVKGQTCSKLEKASEIALCLNGVK